MTARWRQVTEKPPAYVAWRVATGLRRDALRVPLALARRGLGPQAATRILPGPRDQVLARTAEAVSRLGAWESAAAVVRGDPARRQKLTERAERAVGREFELFGSRRTHVPSPVEWCRDPVTGDRWPLRFHRSIDYRNDGRRSDVKRVWELSRLRHLVALAQHVAVSGDSTSLAIIEDDLDDWRRANPVGWSVNWSVSMEVALRAVNLICVDGLLGPRWARRADLVTSLYQHGWFLRRHLEISDLNGNHYLANAVGLVWLGRYFGEAGEARDWLQHGLEMVRRAAREQVLADGLDHEGSLPYHLLVLELFLLARRAVGDDLAVLDPTLVLMTEATIAITGPNGSVPDLGDDDGGRALALCDAPSRDARRILTLAGAVLNHDAARAAGRGGLDDDALWLIGPPDAPEPCPRDREMPRHFDTAGLVLLGKGPDRVVLDVGPVGFRGRGGHGHLDAMSLQIVLGNRLCVRDSGTGSYTGDPELREELRAATAHTVVVLDGCSYATLGGTSRLWTTTGDSPPTVRSVRAVRGGHEAIAEQILPASRGSGLHIRCIRWRPGQVDVDDTVMAPSSTAVAHIVQLPSDARWIGGSIQFDGGTLELHSLPEGASAQLIRCRASDAYDEMHDATRLCIRYSIRRPSENVRWAVIGDRDSPDRVARLPA